MSIDRGNGKRGSDFPDKEKKRTIKRTNFNDIAQLSPEDPERLAFIRENTALIPTLPVELGFSLEEIMIADALNGGIDITSPDPFPSSDQM